MRTARFLNPSRPRPLPITYRNLAVCWFSEKQHEKAAGYLRQALALAPDDAYNQVFSAVYLAAAGHKDEAIAVAKANEKLMDASYNLAAIWAQAGDRTRPVAGLDGLSGASARLSA